MKDFPISKMMIIRTVILVLAWLNQYLVLQGNSPLPFDDKQTEEGVTYAITLLASLWSWWKDNDVTRQARYGKQVLKDKGLK